MAKKSMKARDVKRTKCVNKHAAKRLALKQRVVDVNLDYEVRMAAQHALQKLPRNASPIRRQNRCRFCGRPHAVYRKIGLCRIHFREYAMCGEIPGVVKSSW